jgi:hypothetical protein
VRFKGPTFLKLLKRLLYICDETKTEPKLKTNVPTSETAPKQS